MCKVHRETTGHQVWHWSEIGLDLLVKAGYVDSLNKALYQAVEARRNGRPFGEYGIDALSFGSDGVYHSLQAKIRNTSKVHARDLATFVNVVLLRLAQKNPLSKGYLYTNARLEINVFHDLFKRSGNFELRTMAPSTLRPTDAAEVVAPFFTLRPYQVQALQALDEWENEMFLLQQPCGTGKTLTFAEHGKKYDTIFCIAPLMMSARQNFDVVRSILGADYTSLLADSDGSGATRNPDRILEVMQSHKSFISATYKTFTDMVSDIILDNPDLYKSMLVIVDEAHNATAEMMDVLDLLSSMDIKVLLSTATPPAALSAPEEDDIKFDAVQKIWRESVNTVYHYTFADAIRDGFICDYELRLPLIEGPCEDVLGMQGHFLLDGMERTGVRRPIVFCESIEECAAFSTRLVEIARTDHSMEVWVGTVTCEVSAVNRAALLQKFESDPSFESYHAYILFSVHILGEAVDLPRCDSICNLHPSNSTDATRSIQQMMRASRLDPIKPMKLAQILLWLPDGDMPAWMNTLKEYDSLCMTKIRRQSHLALDADNGSDALLREETESFKTQESYKVQCLTAAEIKETKIQKVIEIMRDRIAKGEEPVPPQTYTVGDWKVGVFIKAIRSGNTNITDAQRQRLLRVCPTFFESLRPPADARIQELFNFITTHQALPAQGSDNKETRSLYNFMRRFRADDNVSAADRQRFERLHPGFFKSIISEAEVKRATLKKIDQLLDHVAENKRVPPRKSPDVRLKKMAILWRHIHTNTIKAITAVQQRRFEQLGSQYVRTYNKRKPASTGTDPASDDDISSDSDSGAESDKKKQRV
ncbi:P-loop containing nucleoside triphosphate hydrolase protein [Tribonema minus]|uniref:P-loop containing nucleoside triphosphate hydrolase protein n=1 Tax=Tribonema minus TaxID=303371 RepID=A0A836CG59_9STRA|nr:P-loop containing nucleoside triphosphate hydrolase protein [Tribonema minus]